MWIDSKIGRMRNASHLLPDPGGEVVRECLDEIERSTQQEIITEERVKALLYLLMRDELPTGQLVQKIKDITEGPTTFQYTATHLAAYAAELSAKLLSIPAQDTLATED